MERLKCGECKLAEQQKNEGQMKCKVTELYQLDIQRCLLDKKLALQIIGQLATMLYERGE